MHQWISAVNAYYYPYMIYHVSHERRVFPELGIASDEKGRPRASLRSRSDCEKSASELGHGNHYLLGPDLTSRISTPAEHPWLGLTPGRQDDVPETSAYRWRERMEALPTVQSFVLLAAAAGSHRACTEVGDLASRNIRPRD
jgi:glutathione S-transferase